MKIEWYDVVNINNLTTKYNNNNNLHGLMRYELINRSLDLITVGNVIYCNVFFLSWSEQTWQTCYLFR